MIQDIAPHIYYNEYKPVPAQPNDAVLLYDGRNVLLKKDEEEVQFPTISEIAADEAEQLIYLFKIDDIRFYLGNSRMIKEIEGFEWKDIQVYRRSTPKHLCFALITGWQLDRWYRTRRYCGQCGSKMVHDEKERMMKCPECKIMEFPKICPAVIVGVTNGNRILFSKYAGREYTNYALLAGFAEVGESIEETVKREVLEEVGLKVKNIRFYKSQPWSMSDSLLLGFFCDLDGEEDIVLDKEELALAEWFEREDIPTKPEDFSLTNEMMMVFKNNLNP